MAADVTNKADVVKYFFLSDGWVVGRVWELGGLWNESAWRRKPEIQRLSLCIWEQAEQLWLYRVETAVLMVEVTPGESAQLDSTAKSIGQVVLKRLMTSDQVIDRLCQAERLETVRYDILVTNHLDESNPNQALNSNENLA